MASHRYVLGLNLTRTRDGIALDDGAAVLLDHGAAIVAVAEERLTRRKHAGGVASAARYCLASQGLSLTQADRVAVSICCDTPPDPAFARDALRSEGLQVRGEQLRVVPTHHLSHAASAYYPSGFEEALIVVADNEGNIIGQPSHQDYWHNRLERTSVYIGRGKDIRLLRRYGDRPGELSLGSAYNHFTKWLGFTSYHDSGKVMALAAYGRGRLSGVEVFSAGDENLLCRLPRTQWPRSSSGVAGRPAGPPDEFDRDAARLLHGESVRKLVAEQAGIDVGPARSSCREPDETQQEIAWLIQAQLEQALTEIVRRAVARTGISRVCLAGGVALNCVANTLIASLPEVDELFIQPAASDVGQALGNALWAHRQEEPAAPRWTMRSCSLGRTYTRAHIEGALQQWRERITVSESGDVAATAAGLIANSQVVGWFEGGSEYGLRGLGRRSVLGDPRTRDTKTRLDTAIKRREPFRPYAPSVLEEEVAAWFATDSDFQRTARQPMSCMLVAPKVRPDRRRQIPAVTFIDGSARLQAVSRAENPRYHDLIRHFQALTGVPLVLNTSFNAGGDPLVETPLDALHSMFKMSLDALVLGDLIVRPRLRPHRRQAPVFQASGITAEREAAYYDLFTEWREDIGFFVTVATKHGGPVLEAGCGTGRVTRQIAAAGINIDGFDISPERLRIARKVIPAEHGVRVRLFRQDMRDFSLPGSYRLVMFPYRVLQELATVEEKIQCLSRVHAHLGDGGLVLIDNYNPSIPMLARDPAASARVMQKTGADGETVRRTDRVVSRDYLAQTQQLEVIYDVRHSDGRAEHFVIPYETSYLFRFELEHLLARCGFSIREVWGGFGFEPFGQGASDELVVLAERAVSSLQPAAVWPLS